ncbi:MAG: pyridoxal-dependent decarboxylase [Steroidobacteraceae bacterium]
MKSSSLSPELRRVAAANADADWPVAQQEVLRRSTELLESLLADEDRMPAGRERDPAVLRDSLSLSLPDKGLPLDDVFARMGEVLRLTPSTSSWRFLNQLFGGREPVAVAAESLALWRNVSMYTYKAAGAQVLVEDALLSHMLRRIGFPRGEGAFLPGGSLANLAALLLARDRAEPEQRDRGVAGRFAVYASSEAHYSLRKNAGIVGLGRQALHALPADHDGRMNADALATRIEQDRQLGVQPLMIVATAGTTVRGAFDDIAGLAQVAGSVGAWLHVDGALGASLVMSPAHRSLLGGIELADSVSWNPHKMMGVPLQSSVLLLSRRGALARSFDERADYLFQADEDPHDPGHRSLQCGRRADAFKLWAAWLHLGDEGWAARVDRQLLLAARAAELIEADGELTLCERPMSVNVCFQATGCAAEDVCERLDRAGRLKIGYGDVRGQPALRLVCVNPALTEQDLVAILAEVKSAAREIRAARSYRADRTLYQGHEHV